MTDNVNCRLRLKESLRQIWSMIKMRSNDEKDLKSELYTFTGKFIAKIRALTHIDESLLDFCDACDAYMLANEQL